MYLSRLHLDPRNSLVRRDMANCHQMHRTIMSAFPDAASKDGKGARESMGVLHRVELAPRNDIVVLIVQSLVKPDWGGLPPKYVLNKHHGTGGIEVKDVSFIQDLVKEKDVYRFRLRANPTRKVGTSSKKDRMEGKPKKNGKRVPILVEEEQIAWLERKASKAGFRIKTASAQKDITIPDVLVRDSQNERGWKKSAPDAGRHKLTLRAIRFDGRLEVTDSGKFISAIKKGIGSGKAYGFGLLSIAKP